MEMKISQLLTDESKWCQHYYALNVCHRSVPFDSTEARQWCLLGAARVCKYNERELLDFVRRATTMLSETATMAITFWQDTPKRTFAEVRSLLLSIGH